MKYLAAIALLLIVYNVGVYKTRVAEWTKDGTQKTNPTQATPTTRPSPSPIKTLEIIDKSYKVTEKNRVWWRFSWRVDLKNVTDRIVVASVELKWVDKDKLIIDDDSESVTLNPGETKSVSGYTLIDVQTAPAVVDADINIKW